MSLQIRARVRATMDRFGRRFPRAAKFLGFAKRRRKPLTAVFVVAMHIIGFILSISAVMATRTPQGAIAWAISLNTCPYLAVPAYWAFGDSGMENYFEERAARLGEVRPLADKLIADIDTASISPDKPSPLIETLATLGSLPVTKGNKVELLIDGKNTFRSIFDAIDNAEKYIIVQFFIIRSDGLGNELKDKLVRKAKEGVRVFMLYDDYGSLDIGDDYVSELRDAGVAVHSFMNLGGDVNRFQLNFRNHRKLVIVDGKTAFVGGHNVGDEYLGKHPTLTPWRDSHMRVTGPAVTCMQIPFAEDWAWATGKLPEDLDWDIKRLAEAAPGPADAVCVASGPADRVETCSLFFQAALHSAKRRIWIASPYFVPDNGFIQALQLAALRGVEVKILIPELADSQMPYLSSFSYLEELEDAGVEVRRYQDGFLHQKVLLVDDDFSAVGSANLDNRSFRLNFELMLGVSDEAFAAKVEKMLSDDFAKSRLATASDLNSKSGFFKLKVAVSRLLAPIQ